MCGLNYKMVGWVEIWWGGVGICTMVGLQCGGVGLKYGWSGLIDGWSGGWLGLVGTHRDGIL